MTGYSIKNGRVWCWELLHWLRNTWGSVHHTIQFECLQVYQACLESLQYGERIWPKAVLENRRLSAHSNPSSRKRTRLEEFMRRKDEERRTGETENRSTTWTVEGPMRHSKPQLEGVNDRRLNQARSEVCSFSHSRSNNIECASGNYIIARPCPQYNHIVENSGLSGIPSSSSTSNANTNKPNIYMYISKYR